MADNDFRNEEVLGNVAIISTTEVNENGGYFHWGRQHNDVKKAEVADIYVSLCLRLHPNTPSLRRVAKECKVSRKYVTKVTQELKFTGELLDPVLERHYWEQLKGSGVQKLLLADEMILFALYLDAPERPSSSYCHVLFELSGGETCVSGTFISRWFKERFDHQGNF